MAELCAEATIRKAAALAVRNATPLPGTAYKLGLPGQQIVDVVQALAQSRLKLDTRGRHALARS